MLKNIEKTRKKRTENSTIPEESEMSVTICNIIEFFMK